MADPSLLPTLVQQYAERVLPSADPAARRIRLTQQGEMVLKPGARPRPFTATEEFEVDRVGFAWRAAFPILGPVGLRVTDSYRAGDGRLEVRLMGLPLQRRGGAELAQGQAYRYLAELPWVPHAIVTNPELEWREVDESAVEVATRVGGQRVAVKLRFNPSGEITETYAERPRAEAGNAVTPWIGEYNDYRTFGEVTVPSRGEVRWDLPEGPFTYWRGTITSFEILD